MKVSQIKNRLYARLLAASTIFLGQAGTGTVQAAPKLTGDGYKLFHTDIQVQPRTEFEYPIGRKKDGVLPRVGLIILDDSDSTHVEVRRKKDNVSLGKFLKSVAEEMVAKAKAQKKASLMIVAA